MADITWRNALTEQLKTSELYQDVPMCEWTSMEVGGPADLLVLARSEEDVLSTLRFAKDEGIPCLLIGKGSNIIVRDGGIRGIVLSIALDDFSIRGVELRVKAGRSLPFIAREAIQKNLAGLEFAQGIPGSIGGAVWMNAGAYGGEISDVLKEVRYIDNELTVQTRTMEPGDMGYRQSIFSQNDYVILEALFQMKRDVDGTARKNFDEYRELRKEKQPLDWPSAGSVFKRPERHYAAQLIDEAGLRGVQIGGALVSPKHAGFIVNAGGATATDVISLIETIQETVEKRSGICLEIEPKIVGDDEYPV